MTGILKRSVNAAWMLVVLVCSGCATLNEEECQHADWVEIGYQDGTKGYPDQLQHHVKACSKHGVVADADRYRSGHLRGITEYCVPATGYQLGVDKEEYDGQCPQAQEAEFVAEYVYGLRGAMDSLKIEQEAVDGDLDMELMAKYSSHEDQDTDRIDDRIEDLRYQRDKLLDQRRKISSWIQKWDG